MENPGELWGYYIGKLYFFGIIYGFRVALFFLFSGAEWRVGKDGAMDEEEDWRWELGKRTRGKMGKRRENL